MPAVYVVGILGASFIAYQVTASVRSIKEVAGGPGGELLKIGAGLALLLYVFARFKALKKGA